MKPIPLRLRNPPSLKKFSPPAAIILSQGKVKAFYNRSVKGSDGKIKTERVELEKDIQGRIILEPDAFKQITKEILERRAYDNYVKKTVKEFNQVGKKKENK